MDSKEVAARVRREIEPVVERDGSVDVHVEFVHENGRWILRVYIDREDGVKLSDCERVSRLISPALDVADPIDTAYSLEVSSPGVERPLVVERDFERFAGERVKIVSNCEHHGRRKFTGELVGIESADVMVRVDGELFRVPLVDIDKANLAPRIGGC